MTPNDDINITPEVEQSLRDMERQMDRHLSGLGADGARPGEATGPESGGDSIRRLTDQITTLNGHMEDLISRIDAGLLGGEGEGDQEYHG